MLHFAGSVERRFHAAKLLDQVDCAFVADSGRAGNVVYGIAFQREEIGNLTRLDAHELFDLCGIVPGVVLCGIEHADFVVDELEHVLIARDNDHFKTLFDAPA